MTEREWYERYWTVLGTIFQEWQRAFGEEGSK